LTRLARTAWGAGLLLSGLALAAGARCGLESNSPLTAGKALFHGTVPLKARMVGHDTDLPATAVRCSNCHSRQPAPAAAANSAAPSAVSGPSPQDTFGSQLSRASLLESRPRRGGPRSRYDEASFCRVLREGIDPASVMISQTMPRYRVTPQECHQLWTFAVDE
jgi:hypothetical protein